MTSCLQWRRLKQQRRCNSSKPNLAIKQDFTFASEHFRSLKLSWTYLKLSEPQRWTLRRESSQLRRPWEYSVNSSRRQVLIFLFPPPEELVLTKRNELKKTASIYDPFGFLTPFVVRAKMLMEEAWMEAIRWKILDGTRSYHTI